MIHDLTGIEEAQASKEEKEESNRIKQAPAEQRESQLYLFAV
ncbi:hypothetical protein [Paenibacillus sp. 1P07SE]